MVDIFNTGSTGFKQNSYGNIQRIGTTPNGRAIYRVIDSQGEESGKLSVPQNQVDKFESAYRDVMDTAPQIQKFVLENSSEQDIKKRRNKSRAIVATGGIIGAAVPIALTKNVSRVKSILATVAGILSASPPDLQPHLQPQHLRELINLQKQQELFQNLIFNR